MSQRVRRYTLGGALVGLALGALWLSIQVSADRRGVRILGPGEFMFLTSLPVSLLTWAAMLLVPPTVGGEMPRGAAYVWLGLTPVLNWAALGAAWGWLRNRAAAARASRPAV